MGWIITYTALTSFDLPVFSKTELELCCKILSFVIVDFFSLPPVYIP